MEPLIFDSIQLKEIPVTIAGVEYVLVEPNSEAGTWYEDAMLTSMTLENGKAVRVGNYHQRNLGLLAQCLYIRGAASKDNKLAGQGFINSLPKAITDVLIEKVKELGGINDEGDEEDAVSKNGEKLGNS